AERARRGDMGVINRVPVVASVPDSNGDPVPCPASYPDFLFFDVEEDQNIGGFAADVSCTAMLGITGCGFEMQLESVLLAVTPSDSEAVAIAEAPGGTGAADLPSPAGSAGCFRAGAIPAITWTTDADD